MLWPIRTKILVQRDFPVLLIFLPLLSSSSDWFITLVAAVEISSENPDHESDDLLDLAESSEKRETRVEKLFYSLLGKAQKERYELVTLHVPIVASSLFSARLFQSTSPVWLCSSGLCLFISQNYCTAVHYRHGNKSKEGKIGFEPNTAVTLR